MKTCDNVLKYTNEEIYCGKNWTTYDVGRSDCWLQSKYTDPNTMVFSKLEFEKNPLLGHEMYMEGIETAEDDIKASITPK